MAIGFDELWQKMKPRIVDLLSAIGGGSGPFAPSPHDLNSAHHTGNISDAQHGSRTVANAHRHSDLSSVGANDHHAQQHALNSADHSGALGASQLPASAIVEGDAGTAAPASVGSSGATAGTGRKYARENHQHIVNAAASYIWTAMHTFQGLLRTRHIEPEAGELYDIGAPDKRYRTIRAAELAATLFSKEQIMILGNKLVIAKDCDILPSAMASFQATYNFERAMTPNDWIQIAAEDTAGNPSTEWIKVGTLVSATTYNISRNVDGSGANNWSEGTPFVVIGQAGDHRIEISAGNPAIIQIIEQGATWNVNTVLNKFSKGGLDMVRSASGGTTGKILWTTGSNTVEIRDLSTLFGAQGYFFTQAPTGIAELNLGASIKATRYASIHLQSTESTGRDEATIRTTNVHAPLVHADPLGPFLSYPGARAVWHGRGYDGAGSVLVMLDRSGGNHHLSLVNSPAETFHQSGSFAPVQTLVLNGTQYATRALETNIQITDYLDFSTVFKLDAVPAVGTIATIFDIGNMFAYVENYGNGNVVIWTIVLDASSTWFVQNISIANNPLGWKVYRARLVLGSTFRVAVNGVFASSAAPTTLKNAAGLSIGARIGGSDMLSGRFYAAVLAHNGIGDDAYGALYESVRPYFGL